MNHFEKEKTEFETNFKEYKNKRIILYGIGRFTATLTSLLNGWNIVGLMDKDPEKTGTYIYGLPVLSLPEAENNGDIIIINTVASYWDLIYQRIKDINVPVYFRNGKKAEDIYFQEETGSWESSYEELKAIIDSYDIISFDFFDTLFCRKVYMESDIWEYVGDACRNKDVKKEFLQLRKSAYANVGKMAPNIYDLYEKICFSDCLADKKALMEAEIALEKKFTEPRDSMVPLVKYAAKKKKEIYVISDMYLKVDFFCEKLTEQGLNIPKGHIWISCEHGCTKKDGMLWRKFQEDVVREKRALHIGDNIESDIENCRCNSNIDTYLIMSKNDMLKKSSIKKILQYVTNNYHHIILGLCTSKIFSDPFALHGTNGRVIITNRKDFGYVVFGPILFSFIYWLREAVMADSIHCLCFLGRDGFFLKQDLEYLYGLLNEPGKRDICYLETSRQILMCASIENEQDFIEYIKMPYHGKLNEFLEDRLCVKLTEQEKQIYSNMPVNLPQDFEKVMGIILEYEQQITSYINIVKENYKKYLNKIRYGENLAVVDLGFYGTTQHYLTKCWGKESIGYYIAADISENNILSNIHTLKSCTKITTDGSCSNSYIYGMGLALESFLTSPHGMVKGIDSDGRFIYAPDTANQVFFEDKAEINEGVQLFIKDMIELHYERMGQMKIYIDGFIDNLYGLLLKNSLFSEDVKRSFYNDNAFIHRRQEKIFDR